MRFDVHFLLPKPTGCGAVRSALQELEDVRQALSFVKFTIRTTNPAWERRKFC